MKLSGYYCLIMAAGSFAAAVIIDGLWFFGIIAFSIMGCLILCAADSMEEGKSDE